MPRIRTSDPAVLKLNVNHDDLKKRAGAVDLYRVLRAAFIGEFGSEAGLLPQHDGWCYSPLWLTPRPASATSAILPAAERHRSLKCLILSMASDDPQEAAAFPQLVTVRLHGGGEVSVSMKGIEFPKLTTVNRSIVEKARVMRRRTSYGLLSQAVGQAELDLFQAQEAIDTLNDEDVEADDRIQVTDADSKPLTGLLELPRPSAAHTSDELADLLERAESKKSILSMRLRWLKGWLDTEFAIWKKTPTATEVSEVSRLVTPKDVDDAIEAMQPVLIRFPEETQPRIIGHWYATLVMRCGVGWREMRAMREADDTGSTSQRHLTWHYIVNRKTQRMNG